MVYSKKRQTISIPKTKIFEIPTPLHGAQEAYRHTFWNLGMHLRRNCRCLITNSTRYCNMRLQKVMNFTFPCMSSRPMINATSTLYDFILREEGVHTFRDAITRWAHVLEQFKHFALSKEQWSRTGYSHFIGNQKYHLFEDILLVWLSCHQLKPRYLTYFKVPVIKQKQK